MAAASTRMDAGGAKPVANADLDCGFRRAPLTDKYELGRVLGEGGFGVVRVVRLRSNGAEYACKTIRKRLDVPNLPMGKQLQHVENIQREVAILRRLRGTLNVVYIEDAYEDDDAAHIIMELCRGGELVHRIGQRHYGEGTVSSRLWGVCVCVRVCVHA